MGVWDNLKEDLNEARIGYEKYQYKREQDKEAKRKESVRKQKIQIKAWKDEDKFNKAKTKNLKGKTKLREAGGSSGLGGLFGSVGANAGSSALFSNDKDDQDKKRASLF